MKISSFLIPDKAKAKRKKISKELLKFKLEDFLKNHPIKPDKWICKCCKLEFFWTKGTSKMSRHINSDRHLMNKSKYMEKLALFIDKPNQTLSQLMPQYTNEKNESEVKNEEPSQNQNKTFELSQDLQIFYINKNQKLKSILDDFKSKNTSFISQMEESIKNLSDFNETKKKEFETILSQKDMPLSQIELPDQVIHTKLNFFEINYFVHTMKSGEEISIPTLFILRNYYGNIIINFYFTPPLIFQNNLKEYDNMKFSHRNWLISKNISTHLPLNASYLMEILRFHLSKDCFIIGPKSQNLIDELMEFYDLNLKNVCNVIDSSILGGNQISVIDTKTIKSENEFSLVKYKADGK